MPVAGDVPLPSATRSLLLRPEPALAPVQVPQTPVKVGQLQPQEVQLHAVTAATSARPLSL